MAGNNLRNLRHRRGSSEEPSNRRSVAVSDSAEAAHDAFDSNTLGESAAKENETPPSSHPRRRDGESPPDRQLDPNAPSNPEEESEDEESLLLTFEALAKKQRIAALKDKIALMKAGTTIPEGTIGEAPVTAPVVTVATPVMSKEPSPHLAHIPDYKVNNIKDHYEWERIWHRLHAISPLFYQSDANKINMAATKLTGPIADAWEREEGSVEAPALTWRYFCDFLLNFIDDPSNRHATMYKAWRKCTQRGDEDLHTYYQRLETIQAEIPELSEEIKRLHFLSTMRPGLRRKLVELQLDGLDRQELLKKGSSLERNAGEGENTVGVKKGSHQQGTGEAPASTQQPFKKFKNREGSSAPRGGKRGYHQPRGDSAASQQRGTDESKGKTSSPNNIPVKERRPLSEVECYECHKKGHLKPNCPELKRRVSGASKAKNQSKNGKTSP